MSVKRVKVEFNDCGERDMTILGDNLRLMRQEEGLFQQCLAESIHKDRSTVSKMELGTIMPTVQALNEVARALGYKMNITFEKRIEEELSDRDFIKYKVDNDIRKLMELKEYLWSYSEGLEEVCLGDNEEYYYGDPDYCPPEYFKYHKERLNFTGDIKSMNGFGKVENEILIFLDNPEDVFVCTDEEWDDRTYICVTSISGKIDSYSMKFVKENVFGRRTELFSWEVDTPMNVIIAAENIKKAYLEKLEKVDFNNIDITNESSLTWGFEFEKDVYQEMAEHYIEYLKVIDKIENHNNTYDGHYIEFDYNMNFNNEAISSCFIITYKGAKWSVVRGRDKYTLSLCDVSKEINMKFTLPTPEEVIGAVLKYS